MRSIRIAFTILLLLAALFMPVQAAAFLSDGSDGAFNPTGDLFLDFSDDGFYNFTSIDINSGISVTMSQDSPDTPIYLLATQDIHINGDIIVEPLPNGDGGHLYISTPGVIYLSGSITLDAHADGGNGGTITFKSDSSVTLSDQSYISAQGNTDPHSGVTVSNGSIQLSVQGISGTEISTIYDGGQFMPISLGSGDIKLSLVPIPSSFLLLGFGLGFLARFRRSNSWG